MISRRHLLTTALLCAGGLSGCSLMPASVGADIATMTGERRQRILASRNWKNGAFQNAEPIASMPIEKKSRLSTMAGFLFEDQKGQEPEFPIPSIATNLKTLQDDQFLWFGHSGFLFKKGGLSILLDPALNPAFPLSFPRFYQPFKGTDCWSAADLPDQIDVLLITHDHYDHLDFATVLAIRERVQKVICPLAVGMHLEKWGYDAKKICELDWWESVSLPQLKVSCVPSQHFSGRTFERNLTLWGGFVLEFPDLTLYVSGDGGPGSHFEKIARQWTLDVAIMETGQYNEAWAGIHLCPPDWKRAVRALNVPVVIPCHNSRFDISRHLWKEPLEKAAENADALGVRLVTPRIGEPLVLGQVKSGDVVGERWWEQCR